MKFYKNTCRRPVGQFLLPKAASIIDNNHIMKNPNTSIVSNFSANIQKFSDICKKNTDFVIKNDIKWR